MEIRMKLDINQVNALCAICDAEDFDVNVMCGRICVDGRSVMGVMEMCGRVVTIVPITNDDFKVEEFFRKLEKIGAYKSEGFYS